MTSTSAPRLAYVPPDLLTGALHLDGSCSLLVGNFNRHRNSWLVISVLRGLRAEPSLLDELEVVA
jgi:hypothetical protein